MKYVTVYYKESGMTLFPEVAEKLGLRNGQHIDAATQRIALRANCEHGIALCQLEIAMDKMFDREPKEAIIL